MVHLVKLTPLDTMSIMHRLFLLIQYYLYAKSSKLLCSVDLANHICLSCFWSATTRRYLDTEQQFQQCWSSSSKEPTLNIKIAIDGRAVYDFYITCPMLLLFLLLAVFHVVAAHPIHLFCAEKRMWDVDDYNMAISLNKLKVTLQTLLFHLTRRFFFISVFFVCMFVTCRKAYKHHLRLKLGQSLLLSN